MVVRYDPRMLSDPRNNNKKKNIKKKEGLQNVAVLQQILKLSFRQLSGAQLQHRTGPSQSLLETLP